MSIEIDLSELTSVVNLLREAPKQAADAAYKAGVDVGDHVKRGAMAMAPADRPWLKTSGYRKKSWRDARGSHTDVFTTTDPEGRNVGFYVEFGTSDTPPNPVLSSQMPAAGEEFETEIIRRVDPLKE